MQVPWQEVFAHWRQAEEERWKAIYQERGFATWEEWRMTSLRKGRPETRLWTLEDAANVTQWFIGGFQGWKKYRPHGQEFTTFGEVATSPLLLENPKVKELAADLHPTRFIGIRCNGEIGLIDGTHRASAYAYRTAQGMSVPACTVYLAEIPKEEKILFDNFRRDIPSARK